MKYNKYLHLVPLIDFTKVDGEKDLLYLKKSDERGEETDIA